MPPPELISGIRAVATGAAVLAPSVTRQLIEIFVEHPPHPSTKDDGLGTLTEREREVHGIVKRGRG